MKLDRIIFTFLFFSLVISTSCNNEEPPINEPDPMEEIMEPDENANFLNLKSDYIFDQSKLHTFELTLSESNLNKLDSDPSAEQYEEGSLTFEGETVSKVGIRYKGSIGVWVGCLSGGSTFDPSGFKTCTKLSMKVKFNWNNPEDKFYGLKKLQFHSMNLDDSQMHERLGYWFFREMGVHAPRSVHARLIVNGEYVGVFALTEQIDGRFARFNFDDGTGNIYKEIWPITDRGQPYANNSYLSALETNKDENPSVALIRTFGEELAAADRDTIQSVIEKWMDIDEIISYIVVDRSIRHDDGPYHWYCGGGQCDNHNYFWYEDPSTLKMHLIPWDLDNAFENIMFDANPVTPVADKWNETRANCQAFSYGSWGILQRSAACDKLMGGWATYGNKYEQIKSDFFNDQFSETKVNELINTWSTQIRDATIEANTLHGDAISVSRWESAMGQLESQLDFARNN